MKLMIVGTIMIIFSSCSTLPQLYQSIEDIADDEAIKITISKEAIQKQTDVDIDINIKNNQTAAN